MVKTIGNIVKKINSVYEWLGVGFLVILIVACVLQVFTRKVLGASMDGTEECARYCFVWMVMLGSSLCVASGGHASVEVLNNLLKGKVKVWHNIIIQIFILFVAIVMIEQGLKMCGITVKQLSPTLQLSMSLIYLAVPVSGAGIVLNIINNILNFGYELKDNGKELA